MPWRIRVCPHRVGAGEAERHIGESFAAAVGVADDLDAARVEGANDPGQFIEQLDALVGEGGAAAAKFHDPPRQHLVEALPGHCCRRAGAAHGIGGAQGGGDIADQGLALGLVGDGAADGDAGAVYFETTVADLPERVVERGADPVGPSGGGITPPTSSRSITRWWP